MDDFKLFGYMCYGVGIAFLVVGMQANRNSILVCCMGGVLLLIGAMLLSKKETK